MKIVGHRGARGLAPENTLASIQAALDTHVDEIEIDVRVTKDGQTILNHDPILHGTDLSIKAHRFAELKAHKHDCIGLEEAIRFVDKRARLMIEVKPRESVEPIIFTLEKMLASGWTSADFVIGSFSQQTLAALHTSLPQLDTVVIAKFSGLHARWRAYRLHTKTISMNHHALWFGFISFMRWRGYKLYTYSLNDPVKARKWAARGLYGVITDRPDVFKES